MTTTRPDSRRPVPAAPAPAPPHAGGSVVLPALRPAAAVLAIFTFMQTWNDFLWPLVALQDPRTLRSRSPA
jgi:hypothetical protein